MPKIGVVLLGAGEPDKLNEIKEYLISLHEDPFLFPFPYARGFLTKIMAARKTQKAEEEFNFAMGTPDYGKTISNFAKKFKAELLARNIDAEVFFATRYYKPSIRKIAKKVSSESFDITIIISIHPQYSKVISGAFFREWEKYYTGNKTTSIQLTEYHSQKLFISAVSEKIAITLRDNSLTKNDNPLILFCAESVSRTELEHGDPYCVQMEESVRLIMENFEGYQYKLGYYNNIISEKSLFPDVKNLIKNAGTKSIVVVPLSSPGEDFHTFYKLNHELKNLAHSNGIKHFYPIEKILESEKFTNCMVTMVKGALKFAGV